MHLGLLSALPCGRSATYFADCFVNWRGLRRKRLLSFKKTCIISLAMSRYRTLQMKKCIVLITLVLLTFYGALAQNLQPTDKLALLVGTVTDMKGKPLAGEIIMFVNENTKAVVEVHTDAKGKFEALVPVATTYELKYKNFTLDMQYSKMQIPADRDATYEVQVKIEPPKEFVLENVYFDTGKSTLKPSSNKSLNDLVEVLKLKSSMVIEIQGHTDNVGSDDANIRLSQARAEEVRKYLVSKGIAPARVHAKGYGPTMPIADNADEKGRARNRRTNLKVLSE
jgi:outer membrane protein OmpA-like peptidoglycan-associated protein